MRALFHDTPLIHHEDFIGVLNSGKAVRHDKTRTPFHHGIKGFLNFDFRTRIDGRSRLV